jgi:hypothetical protein
MMSLRVRYVKKKSNVPFHTHCSEAEEIELAEYQTCGSGKKKPMEGVP